MKRLFRKYHRVLALILSLPLCLTVLTGMAYTILSDWLDKEGQLTQMLLGLHTGEVIHLQAIYPIVNGLGILGLLVTGLSMSGVFGKRPQRGVGDAS